mgnify:CR=1 FL=1
MTHLWFGGKLNCLKSCSMGSRPGRRKDRKGEDQAIVAEDAVAEATAPKVDK